MVAKWLWTVLFFLPVSVCFGSTIYKVTIDTSSQSGNNGAIYFQFAGGLNPDLASVSVTAFSIGSPGGLSSTPAPFFDGDVTGSLDVLPLTINNSNALNDYEHYLVFGSSITFQVSFNLPPVLTGQSGSELLWQLTSSDGLTPILTVDNSGNIGQISYDTKGVFTTDTLGNGAIETIAVPTSPLPEPATGLLALIGAGCFLVRRTRIR